MVTLILPEIRDSEFDDKERVNANEMGIVLEARRNSTGNRKKAIIRGVVPVWSVELCGCVLHCALCKL